jgi:hypothetical protein
MVAPDLADQPNDLVYPVDNLAMSTLRVVDHDIAKGTSPVLDKVSIPPTDEVTAEIDGATDWLGLAPDEILLAALGRTIARTIGDGVVAVDVTGERRWQLHAIPLICATAQQTSATEMLGNVHRMFGAEPVHAAPLASEIFLNYIGTLPDGTQLHLDWWYDTSRFDRYTVEELTEQFPFALFEMTSDAAAPV